MDDIGSTNEEQMATNRSKKDANCVYKQKCARLQQHIKEYLFENSSLEQQIRQQAQDLSKAKQQRQFLLRKLFNFQSDLKLEGIYSKGGNEPKKKQPNQQIKEISDLFAESRQLTPITSMAKLGVNANTGSSSSSSSSTSSHSYQSTRTVFSPLSSAPSTESCQ